MGLQHHSPESHRGAHIQLVPLTLGVVASDMAEVIRHLPPSRSSDQAAQTELLKHSSEQSIGLYMSDSSSASLPFKYSS